METQKKLFIFQEMELSVPKILINKTFLNFLAPKNLMKMFYTVNNTFFTLNKNFLGETGCLSNLYITYWLLKHPVF